MDNREVVLMSIFIFFVALLVGLVIGVTIEKSVFYSTAIEKGFAEYHSKTGEWQWKENH